MKFYNRKDAKVEITKILNNKKEIVKTGMTIPIRPKRKFDVYRVPLELLAPNVRNDRIASQVRQFEAEQKKKLDVNDQKDVNFVFNLIEKESPADNNKTIKSLKENGQQVDAIITNDGIVIDGNRRFTLLRKLFLNEYKNEKYKIEEFRFLNAIIHDEDIKDNEILALETQIQIGEVTKVDYNPINIYIKIDNLLKANYNHSQIAGYMNIEKNIVEEKIAIFKEMNDYLDHIGKKNHFTLLFGLEDQFISTKKVFRKIENKTYNVDWEYDDDDITDFKSVCYDYMRTKFEGKKFREQFIGGSNKADGVFMDKNVWKDFYKKHEKIVEESTLKSEEDWQEKKFVSKLDGNLNHAQDKLKNKKETRNLEDIIELILLKVESLDEITKTLSETSAENLKNIKIASSKLFKIFEKFE